MTEEKIIERFEENEDSIKKYSKQLVAHANKFRDLEEKFRNLEQADSELRQDIKDTIAYLELFKATIPAVGQRLSSEQQKQLNDVFTRLHTRYGNRPS